MVGGRGGAGGGGCTEMIEQSAQPGFYAWQDARHALHHLLLHHEMTLWGRQDLYTYHLH